MNDVSLLDYPWGQNLGDTIQASILSRFLLKSFSNLSIDMIGRDFPCPEHLSSKYDDFELSTLELSVLANSPLVLCGWLTQNPIRLVSLALLTKAAIGIHISTGWPYTYPKLTVRDFFKSPTFRAIFGQINVITTRDLNTQQFLSDVGIKSQFSGCVSVLAGVLDYAKTIKGSSILTLDLSEASSKHLTKITRKQIYQTSNKIPGLMSRNRRQQLAEKLMCKVKSSELVITSRLHVALPATSMGIPSILVIAEDDPRISGLKPLLNIVDPCEFDDLSFKELQDRARTEKKLEIELMQGQNIEAITKSIESTKMPGLGTTLISRDLVLEILSEIIQEKEQQSSKINLKDLELEVNYESKLKPLKYLRKFFAQP